MARSGEEAEGRPHRPQVASGGKQGHGLKVCQGLVTSDIRENFFMDRVDKHWKGLPREAVGSLLLEVFTRHGVVLGCCRSG